MGWIPLLLVILTFLLFIVLLYKLLFYLINNHTRKINKITSNKIYTKDTTLNETKLRA